MTTDWDKIKFRNQIPKAESFVNLKPTKISLTFSNSILINNHRYYFTVTFFFCNNFLCASLNVVGVFNLRLFGVFRNYKQNPACLFKLLSCLLIIKQERKRCKKLKSVLFLIFLPFISPRPKSGDYVWYDAGMPEYNKTFQVISVYFFKYSC